MAKKIYVGNIAYSTTEDGLKQTFANYGEVISVDIIKDKISGKSKGFAFVQMSQDGDADNAMNSLNGFELDGRKLKVNEAKERSEGERRNFGGRKFSKFKRRDNNYDNG